MNNKMVSIVIPVYNLQNYLEECIQSLINQSWKDIEILLIDDGSTDNSSVLCDDLAKKDKRIRVLHKKNGGVSSARNAGISMAKGEYITFIDGDDWVSEKYIETLYHLITSYSADVVASGFFYTYETGVCKKVQLVTEVATISGMDALNQACDIQTPWVGFACGKLVKTEVLLKYKISFDPQISICEDSLFWYNVFNKVNTVVKSDKSLYYYRIRQASATRSANKNLVSLKTKITAFEKAYSLALLYPESQFQIRVYSNLVSSIVLYMTGILMNKKYTKKEGEYIKGMLKKLKKEKCDCQLPVGIRIRLILFSVSPKVLYGFEYVKNFIRGE